MLRSDKTHYSSHALAASDRADTVLDVRQIARWAGCLGGETTVVPVADARHDVFLSLPHAREAAYAVLDAWLDAHRSVLAGGGGRPDAGVSAPRVRVRPRLDPPRHLVAASSRWGSSAPSRS